MLIFSNVRVDIPSIRELVSTISYQALPTDFKPDSVMYARTIGFSNSNLEAQTFVTSGSRLGRIEKFENATGYSVSIKKQSKVTELARNVEQSDFFLQSPTVTSTLSIELRELNTNVQLSFLK